MALIDELKEKLETVEAELAGFHADVREIGKTIEKLERHRWDLDIAIAALTPAPAPVEIEDSLAPEGMPECAWETVTLTEAAPADEQDDASEFAESEGDGLGSSLIAMGYGDDDTPAEHISILTGDPAIEPETGLHGDAVEATATKLFDEHWNRHGESDGLWPLSKQPESVQEAWREKARELLAPPSPAVMDMMEEIAAAPEAPVTNPEADALAKAHDWYDPKAVADRNRFNPFAMFRRQTEEV